MKKGLFFCFIVLGALRQASAQSTQPGLDPSFGVKGIAATSAYTNSKFKTPGDLAIQPDGKIIVAGEMIGRFKSDGTPDSTFNGTGFLGLPQYLAPDPYNATSILLQNDGKIIIAINRYSKDSGYLMRLNDNGKIDSTFGGAGAVSMCCRMFISCAALQVDGKVLITGTSQNDSALLIRINTDGKLDTTFNVTGMSKAYIGAFRGQVNGIGMLSDGRIVIGGTGYDKNNQSAEVIVRYLSNGHLDTTLNHSGIVFPLYAIYCNDVVVQSDGKVLMSLEGFNGDKAIIRFKEDGHPDSTFGLNGYALPPPGMGVYKLLITAGNKLLCGGWHNGDYAMARLKGDDGSIDSGFGISGMIKTDITGYYRDFIYQLALQPDGRIVAAGNGRADATAPIYVALARYNSDATVSVGNEPKLTKGKAYLSPNPAGSIVRMEGVSVSDLLYIDILSAEGRLIRSIAGPESVDVSVEGYATGLYFIRLVSRTGIQCLRLVIKH